MSGYALAWWLVAVAGAVGLFGVYMLLRHYSRPYPLVLLVVVLAAVLFTPAPVPKFDGQWAPAFTVAVFEGFFQIQGSPGAALRILGAAVLFAIVLVSGVAWLLRLRQRRISDAGDSA